MFLRCRLLISSENCLADSLSKADSNLRSDFILVAAEQISFSLTVVSRYQKYAENIPDVVGLVCRLE